ncbi:MAG: heme-copper oxidase subunit III [Pyrinomonadaceae bacterium]
MKVGAVEIIDETVAKKRRPLPRLSGTGGSGQQSGGRDPGGPGGDRPDDEAETNPNRFIAEKSRILTGFLLLVVLMTFGGLVAAYIVIATNNVAEWQPFNLPVQVWLSTILILISGATYQLGKRSVDNDDQPRAKRWFIVTTVLGAAFISSQLLAWIALANRGLYMHGNPYAGFFYILTAVHAVHVLGGIAALGGVLLHSWKPITNLERFERRRSLAQVVGWYWHFMGALWIFLFILLGFWK